MGELVYIILLSYSIDAMLPMAVAVLSVVLCLSHVYAVADAAFQQSQASTQEQCIIIR